MMDEKDFKKAYEAYHDMLYRLADPGMHQPLPELSAPALVFKGDRAGPGSIRKETKRGQTGKA